MPQVLTPLCTLIRKTLADACASLSPAQARVGIRGDALKLATDYGLCVQNIIELGSLANGVLRARGQRAAALPHPLPSRNPNPAPALQSVCCCSASPPALQP